MNEPPERTARPASLLSRWIPGLSLFRHYQRQWLLPDLLAGVSVCVVMIPAVIAYAGLMGLAPQHGLYAALVSLFVYALLGSSRQLIVGPDVAISLLTASVIGPLAAGNAERAATLAALVAILSGLLLLLGAPARIGAVADFLSKPVLVGYMTGAALILMASQLGKLFGVRLTSNDFFPLLAELAGNIRQVHGPTALLGLALLLLLFVLRQVSPRIPVALAGCVVAIAVSELLHLDKAGVALVGSFPAGLPRPAVPDITWRDIHSLLPAAIGIALLTYTEGILLARAFAARNRYEVNANQELVALGAADVITGFLQGFCVTGSQARTTLNDATGGKTQLVSFVAGGTLILFLLFLTPVISRLPAVALAAILIYAGFTLVEFPAMLRIYRYYPRSAVAAALTTIGVLAVGVVPGILVGVALSLLGLINRVSNPPDAVLTEVPGHGFHDLGKASAVCTIPGLIVYRFYAPLLFSNVGHFVERVRQLIVANSTPVRWILVDAQAITDLDVTAAEALHNLTDELHRQGIELKIAHANRPLRRILGRVGITRQLRPESFYHSVHECVEAFQGTSKTER